MTFWTADSFWKATEGRWALRPPEGAAALSGVSTDTRTLQPGQVFIALRGERFDGHAYLAEAARAGAPLLVVEDESAAADLPTDHCGVLVVEDTQAALTQLAVAYRRTLDATVIAVTGSVGKTTTKHLIDTVLATRLRGTASPRSYNNHIGVPLTLLAARPTDQYIVVEIGTNAPGEIAALAEIVEPDIAVLTAVGAVHLEGLGTVEDVLREKASLLSRLRDGGLAIVNGEIDGIDPYLSEVPAVVTYGRGDGCDLRLTGYRFDSEGSRFEVDGDRSYTLPLLGEHNALNALAAVAVARRMGLSGEEIADALAATEPAEMRMQRRRIGPTDAGVMLINDAYNANPLSMASALGALAELPAENRRVAILGDMLELGPDAPAFHRELGRQLAESEVDRAILIGPLSLYAGEALSRHWPADRFLTLPRWEEGQTADRVAEMIEPGDTVLIKGSRGMGLERVIPAIEQRLDRAGACTGGERPP